MLRNIFLNLFIIILLSFNLFAGFASKNNKANKLYLKGQYEEALKKYTDAQIDNPESPILHYNMGNTFYKQKQLDKALEEYNKAINVKDNNIRANTLYNIGNTYFQMNDYLKAIENYKKTLEINPNDQDAKYNIEIARKKLQQNMQPNQENNQQDQKKKQNEKKQNSKPQSGKNKNKQNENKQNNNSEQNENKNKMSKEDAKRILDSLKDDEKKKHEKMHEFHGEANNVEKDW